MTHAGAGEPEAGRPAGAAAGSQAAAEALRGLASVLSSTLGDKQARELLVPSLQGSSGTSISALDALSTLQQLASGQPEDTVPAPPSPGKPMLMLTAGDAARACSDSIQTDRAILSNKHYLLQTGAADWCGTGLPFPGFGVPAEEAMQLMISACRAAATRCQPPADRQEVPRVAESKRRAAGAIPAEGSAPSVCPSQHAGQG